MTSSTAINVKKIYHWTCSNLSNYEIKLHKKNPYKPWRCVSCVDRYCIDCNKTFSDVNLDSICCDKCSFWYHLNCSGLGVHDFEYLCNNSAMSWTCPPCKQKFSVSDVTSVLIINLKLPVAFVIIFIIMFVLASLNVKVIILIGSVVIVVRLCSHSTTLILKP